MANSIPTNTRSVDQIAQHNPVSTLALLSTMPLSNWRGSISTFNGFTGTLPVQDIKYVTWQAIQDVIAPTSPSILADKSAGKFFVPCALKIAPLVGNTFDAALKSGQPTIGKMRSKHHVTEATFLVLDVDGIPEFEFKKSIDDIACAGITYFAFTTHSYGREDKPGMRARLVVPVDRPLNIAEYASAWHRFDDLYFSGHAGKADSSGANLYQQQGTWCAHPDRVASAKCWTARGGVASADALIANSGIVLASLSDTVSHQIRPAKVTPSHSGNSCDDYPPSDAIKVADACKQIGSFRDTQGAQQCEPLWFDCLGVVGFCINGDEVNDAIHLAPSMLSDQRENFSPPSARQADRPRDERVLFG